MSALRILIAEDDALIGMMLAETLESSGHVVCAIVASEAEAVDAALRHRPDVMIVDAHLGKGSGVLAVEQIVRAGPIPCVFVTGDVPRVGALSPGAVVLEKPFHEADLLRAIKRVLAVTSTAPTGRNLAPMLGNFRA